MFFKIDVLKDFANVNRKAPVLGPLFNKIAGLRPSTFLKRDSNIGVFL